ncbi:Zn-dependent hydrolase [Salibacterium salarium]|uniref:Zn-dependent hydrolase n=1 Tax=Salibacterium salarium TaxID=284579 RepID=A0A428MX84_9BACI|nr:Zn-dependent hydrolase [Salibacterium salarium]RSL30714.1 Zn-dependent hydrolase [Salibacterium salarium]
MSHFTKERFMHTKENCRTYPYIDPDVLVNRVANMSEIGKTEEGGVTRFVYTEEEERAKRLFQSWMEQAGLTVREDDVGNLYGRLEGTNPHLPAVLTGSHLDTVPNGGAFDGTLGCISSLMAIEAIINEQGRLTHPIELVVFVDEEGSRFGSGLLGSRMAMGEVTKEELFQLRDDYHTTAAEAMKRQGYSPNKLKQCWLDSEDVKAFIEVHIEQGKRLEQYNERIGIVNGIAGPSWLEIKLDGETDHAGNTPMNMRKDAVAGAAELISAIESIPREISSTAVATVGKVNFHPNGSNVIAGRAEMIVDVRDIEEENRDDMLQRMEKEAHRVAEKRELAVETHLQIRIQPVPVPEWIQQKMESSAKALDLPYMHMPSGAGHDAMIVGKYIPSGLLFVPSVHGKSHTPEEFTELKDCIDGVAMLRETLLSIGEEIQ